MAPTKPRQGGATVSSGRRRYLLYQYGNHFWIPETLANFSKGMVRDTAREAIPAGSVYDSADYLLHQPGVAQKRGGTAYLGSALTGASFVPSVLASPFAVGEVLAVGSNSHLFKLAGSTTTDLGLLGGAPFIYDRMVVSPGSTYVVIPGGTNVQKYDGATISNLDAIGHAQLAVYKARLLCANVNRVLFSPTPDVNAAWDTATSWIDCDNTITGFAALNNALLIFGDSGMERIIGSTPPPNSDMDRGFVSPIGCTDNRSIVVDGPYVYFANPEGVYMTNGSTPVSLTEQGGIASYWRSLFTGYVPASGYPVAGSWTIACGWFRGFLFVSVLDDSRNVQAGLMCNVSTRAWWRVTNMKAMSFTSARDGRELYYGDASTNRVCFVSGFFNPVAANKNDADGTPITPTIEFAPIGTGTGVKSYGFGRLDFDMRDAASDNPAMAVTIKKGIEADVSTTPAESPLVETLTLDRKRFQICRDAQAVTISLAQSNASSKTEIYALEVEQRPQSLVGDGIT